MLRHSISPVAGRMRPKTSESGIFSTKRSSPVKVSTLTRILVPKPKKAFQSPGTQIFGFAAMVATVVVIAPSFRNPDLDAVRRYPSLSASISGLEPLTQPKMPPCALIMRRPISWNSGK